METPQGSVLALAVRDGQASPLLRSRPRVPYNADEQHLSVCVRHEIDQLVMGRRGDLVLLKLYPLRSAGSDGARAMDGDATSQPAPPADGVRRAIAERIAADALRFFGPLRGGVVTQERLGDIIAQRQQFTTAYPHIVLDRHDFYDAATDEPLLSAWSARRIQNLRRETQTNRMIDVALLALEVGSSLFPRLLG